MSNAQNFQHKFRINGAAAKVTKPPTRTAVSCIPCRTRKLKCNRLQPCESCTARGCQDACSYSAKPIVPGIKDKAKTQERIDKLEALVLDLARRTPDSINTGSSPESSATAEVLTSAEGQLDQNSLQHGYVGATHFSAILNGIDELRADLVDHPKDHEGADGHGKLASIFRCPHGDDIVSILQTIPSRAEVDRLIPTYFNANFAKLPSLHAPAWFRTYERFWQDPSSVHTLWIAQLFAVMCLAKGLQNLFEPSAKNFQDSLPYESRFLSGCARCLHLAGYLQPGPYVVETLLMYAQCKFYIERNPGGELWLLMSMICSLALRSGLHRDPTHFPELSVFQGEMRRRTWLGIRQFDLLSAWQLGLRSNIQSAWSDTQLPRNLRDEDFDEYMPTLPPSRPVTDVTGILFEISKNELHGVIERVLWEQLRSKHMPDETVWQLDGDLRRSYDKIPPNLKLSPEGKVAPGDSAEIIFMKVKCSILYNKGLCAIHRMNMNTRNRSQVRSLNICVQAATTCLGDMVYVFEESINGGRLCRDRWMRTSVHSSDFFFSASILCWLLSEKRRNEGLECPFVEENKSQVLNNLVKAQQICDDQASFSPEARQVSKALRMILDKSGMLPMFPTPQNGPMTADSGVDSCPYSNGQANLNTLPTNNSDIMSIPPAGMDPTISDGPLNMLFSDNYDGVDWNEMDKFILSMNGAAVDLNILPEWDPMHPNALAGMNMAS